MCNVELVSTCPPLPESRHSTGWDQRGAAEAVEGTDRSSGSMTTSARFSRNKREEKLLLLHEDSSNLQQKWWLTTFRITRDLTSCVQHYQSERVIWLVLNCKSSLNKNKHSVYSSVMMNCAPFLALCTWFSVTSRYWHVLFRIRVALAPDFESCMLLVVWSEGPSSISVGPIASSQWGHVIWKLMHSVFVSQQKWRGGGGSCSNKLAG